MNFLFSSFHGHPTSVVWVCVLLCIANHAACQGLLLFVGFTVMTFMQLISLLLFAFLSLAHLHTTEPSSYASSSQIYILHEQDEPSITKPFIYETVATPSPAGSFLMHANFPQKNEALHLDNGQADHAIKEEAPISTPVFIYESVAASFSSRPRAEGSHLHDNAMPQDAEAALLDDGGKHLPSIAKPSFIYESVAASLPQNTHGGTLLRESAPQEENSFLLDDGMGKPIMKKKVAKQSYIYESVIAASIPLRPPSHGSILRDNVGQEENGFLLDDGTVDPIMQKKEDAIIAKPSFIYESVAASIHPEVHDAIRNNVPQEEHGFLLDDGGMLVQDTVEKGAKPITGKPFYIYENVAAQFHIADHAAGGSHLRDNVSQQENSSLLDDDGKHVHNGLKKEELIKAKLSLGNEAVAASSHPGSCRGSLLGDMKNHKKLPIYHKLLSKEIKKDEESLRMVVGDSSNNMIQTGDRVQDNPSNEENLRMVVSDSSKSMVQEGCGSTSNNMVKKRPFRTRGRGRYRYGLCTSNLPDVCIQLAHAEHMNFIALYGQLPEPVPPVPPVPGPVPPDPACCGIECVDLSTDQLNCGSCGKACLLLETCCNGICSDLNIDDLNCGECGNSCLPLNPCQFGMCGNY